MAQPLDQVRFLEGGGELGALIRAHDWTATPLGVPERWPQSLKTAVRIMLTSRQPVWIGWGPELTYLYNDPYRSIIGGKHPSALGQPFATVWSEIWDVVGPMSDTVMTRDEGTYVEAQLLIMERHGYQEETYYTFSYSPIPDDDGRPGGLICANTDDTSRVIGERQVLLLRELAAQTVDTRNWRDACVRSVEALATNGRDLPFALLYFRDAGTGGFTLAGAAGIDTGHPAAPDHLAASPDARWPVAEVLESGEPRVISFDPSYGALPCGPWPRSPEAAMVLRIDPSGGAGRAGALVVGLNPFRRLDDGYRGFLELVARQIAASIANADAFEQEKRRAESLAEIDRAKTLFFTNVSHEFRTPLTLMLGPLEDALGDAAQALPATQHARIETAHRNGLRLLRLVNALLDFSRIEAGRMQASFVPTDLAGLTTELVSGFRSLCATAGLKLNVRCDDPGEPVYVDTDMWEKIVLNLVSNAFKFTLEGAIDVQLRRDDGWVELTVRDTGTGIPPNEMPRLFQRFHRVHGARGRSHEGSGIGLALVNELVRLHGGELAAKSELGKGSVLTVRLRLGTAHLPTDRIGAARSQASTAARAATFLDEAAGWLAPDANAPVTEVTTRDPDAGSVLLVDDNADLRDYLARLLRPYWSVQTAVDGVDALQRLRERRYDLVLTDVMMPRMDGFELLHAIRADADLRDTAVVMLSARAGEESRIEGMHAGCDDYIVKPFTAREVLARVAAHVASVRFRRATDRERRELLEREKLARQEAELQREHLMSLIMQAPNPICIIRGPAHVVELANDPVLRVWRRTAAEVIGKPLLEALPELTDQAFADLLDQVRRTGVPYHGKEFPAKIVSHGKESTVYFNFVYAPMRDAHGDVESVLVLAFDVTDEVHAREQLDRLRAEAESANRAKDEFLAMLGHELRNPLSPITTALQLMRLRGMQSTEQDVLERQVAHLARLVDDLLDVARVTKGKIELRKAHVDLADILVRAVETASPLLENKSQRLDLDIASGPLAIHGDAARLAQVFSNVLNNAAKYSDPGSTIALRAGKAGDVICVSIQDKGAGVEPDMLERIFEPFAQVPQTLERAQGGLGLGLAIARSLLQLHGGTIRAHSEGVGQGTTFTIELPHVEGEPASAVPADVPHARLTAPAKRMRILVVDDNVDAASSMAMLLEAVGHDVKVANDAPAALRAADSFEPDVALIDIGLPVMDGYELARRLQHSERRRKPLRLIAVTGYGLESDRQRCLAAGFAEHLVKPVDLELLSNTLAWDERAAS